MDELFVPPEPVDFDLDFDESAAETWPPTPERALIASADRDERLYLRAKLALADLTQADEAETGAQALELARAFTTRLRSWILRCTMWTAGLSSRN